ncbi:MAG: indolepyruvate ferredoxin oxidoreductase family protein [Gammaproteobacteria bacterium]
MPSKQNSTPARLDNYELLDRYKRDEGRVFLTGTQALVRIALTQRQLDRVNDVNSAGYISGYRGSPLGAVDQELWRAKALLDEHQIEFVPAVNEDLAATAMIGTQQVETDAERTVDGVFGLWYGKGPGIDRSGDALKHGNAYGSSPTGGVLVIAGDDHGCVSSSMPHQSDVAFLTFMMPHLNPASVAEYIEFGLYGIALSRYSGMWVGFKAISESVESAMSVDLPRLPEFVQPKFDMPPTGLHYRWPDFPGPQIEERLEAKKAATLAFAAANPIDRKIFDVEDARYGIVTTGKAHLDLMEALRLLGIDSKKAKEIGLDVYKVGMVWPLEPNGALDFVKDKHEVLVIEEKRGIIESQFKEYFYDYPGHKPKRMVGKQDESGSSLVPWVGELSPHELMHIVAQRLDAEFPGLGLIERAHALIAELQCTQGIDIKGVTRKPYFCSGCPHNSSTKVPEGSKALAGIGCHFMASWMGRDTEGLIQMGGEGINWVARSKFNGNKHVFQNLGDGTFYHSGSLAIRQALAAGTNITYKILYNDAVAMTGGQPVDGPLTVTGVAHSVRAEGVARIALVTDDEAAISLDQFPKGTTLADRGELDRVQRELREIPGVTVLIYIQTCATEKRRRRKRGLLDAAPERVVINDLVCEGCGDCSVESNCLSVVPKETPFGRKRQIDQNSCNSDLSCLNGFCPSFVTVTGLSRKRPAVPTFKTAESHSLPDPELRSLDDCYDLLVTGVGGTGVITVGALITMAAHLEGKGASVLDFMGFAQKFGPVLSYIRIADTPQAINQVRIEPASADALIGCDLVVSSSPKASRTYSVSNTQAVINTAEMATADFILNRDAQMHADSRVTAVQNAVHQLSGINANRLSVELLGDSIYANVLLLGFAWQSGLVPLTLDALMRAIELNGVKIEHNKMAFTWGRVAAADSEQLSQALSVKPEVKDSTLSQIVSRRSAFLADYQDAALGKRYENQVNTVKEAESALGLTDELSQAVARSYFKLLSYKDEYEVARLHTSTGFLDKIHEEYGANAKVTYHMAPPVFSRKVDARGRPRKRRFGSWLIPAMKILASMRKLRGTALDVFGKTAERKMERALITEFEETVAYLLANLTAERQARACDIAALYMKIRGYGPVKEAAAKQVREEVQLALANFTQASSKAA